jgi:hypothetical protein
MNEPQAPDPEVRAAKEASCSQKQQSCYADCENLKPLSDEITPGYHNPNIIRK